MKNTFMQQHLNTVAINSPLCRWKVKLGEVLYSTKHVQGPEQLKRTGTCFNKTNKKKKTSKSNKK